jgi:hypothetical protein
LRRDKKWLIQLEVLSVGISDQGGNFYRRWIIRYAVSRFVLRMLSQEKRYRSAQINSPRIRWWWEASWRLEQLLSSSFFLGEYSIAGG